MNASAHIVDIDEGNAQQWLIEESQQRPVVVDFWADWCAPCKQLMPLLEKLANEYAGAFLLAKVNADEQQMLASQLGVRNLPTVMVIKDGQPVDGFSGAQPESVIRELLEKYLPSPWNAKITEANLLLEQGDVSEAVALLRTAWEDSNKLHDVTLAYAGALLTANRLDDAEAVLDDVRMVDQDATYEQLRAQIELKREAADSPEIKALEALLATDDNDHELAAQISGAAVHRVAVIVRHWSICWLSCVPIVIGTTVKPSACTSTPWPLVGKGDPLAAEYQRKLFSLMY